MSGTFPIIQTKLYRPPLQADFVTQPQLLEQLVGWQQRPLSLISASAGCGKCTLVSSWLESLDYPTAWLTLDEHGNDLVDYRIINDSRIDELFSAVLNHLPKPLHLVVITRTDPLINLNRLRALGQVTEIRTQQLRFSVMETIELVG